MNAWLDTSAVVALYFRNRANREACLTAIPQGAGIMISRYVIFELARGYLSRLMRFHNASMPCTRWYEVRALVKAGGHDHTYEGPAWRDVLDDIEETLEAGPDDDVRESPWRRLEKTPAFFRSRLRCTLERGWRGCFQACVFENPCGCRADIYLPYEDTDGLMKFDLPTAQCGQPGNCGLLVFVKANASALERVCAATAKLKAQKKKGERERRASGLQHLLTNEAEAFDGTQCHACGDALIALEASQDANDRVVTKDRDFTGICRALRAAKPVMVPHVV
jgi:predicted nucleic acid-binding protein